jgi:predicted nucleotidyltransferase
MAEDIAGPLGEYFRDKEDILLAFIFGSAVSGRLTGQSDVDIAVLFNEKPDISAVLKIKNEAADATGREIDLVILNDASPVIRMQVLRNGKLIKSADTVIYSNFFVKTMKEYDDLKYIRKEAEENILRGRTYA